MQKAAIWQGKFVHYVSIQKKSTFAEEKITVNQKRIML